jgi:uncharacterized membrane protein YfcA
VIDLIPTDLPPPTLITLAALAALMGGFVRGYSGFGFALAAMPILTLVIPPAAAVPAILLIEVAIGVATIPERRSQVARPVLGYLLLGTIVGTPLGLTALALAPAEAMRLAVGVVVLIAVLVLWQRPSVALARVTGLTSLAGAGFVSGLLNGGTAMSGPPVIIALLGSGLPTQTTRATIMAFVAVSAALGIALAVASGLYTSDALFTTLIMAPCAAVGALAGSAVFAGTGDALYRPASLTILFTVACVAIAGACWSLFHSLS